MNADQSFLIISTLLCSLNYWFTSLSLICITLKDQLLAMGSELVGTLDSDLAFGLLWGVQLGQNGSLSRKLKLIGMSSLWSASGLSISLLLSTQRSFFGRLRYIPITKRTILHLLTLLVFWYMSDNSVSLMRALLMATLSLLLKDCFGRQLKSFYSLLLSLGFLLLLDFNLIDSLSLRFSVAAVFAVLYLHPFLRSCLPLASLKHGTSYSRVSSPLASLIDHLALLLNVLIDNFSLFLSIQLGMLPLISHTWGELSLVQLMTNTLIAVISPFLFFIGLIWFLWMLPMVLFKSFMFPSHFGSDISLLLLLPVKTLLQISDQLVQIEQVVLIIPQFSSLSIYLWYGAIFLVGEWHLWRMGRARCARPSLTSLIQTFNS
ncbi:MAG: hypothetical protein XD95_0115 [Microgenomates bacterium 39_7]|nr:MAG: hypothetical protein XD95_0115 [Microgenomates bacterium 39_7]